MNKNNDLVQRLRKMADPANGMCDHRTYAEAADAIDALRAHLPEQGEAVAREYTDGRWHHGNGYLCMGTLRVARADFDTNPSAEVQAAFFDEMCAVLNAHPAPVSAGEADGWEPSEVQEIIDELTHSSSSAFLSGDYSNGEADRKFIHKAIVSARVLLDTLLKGDFIRGAAHPAAPSEPVSAWVSDAVALAYGLLWHVNAGMDAPADVRPPSLTSEKAAYEARKLLRDLMTKEQRGDGINAARAMLLPPAPTATSEPVSAWVPEGYIPLQKHDGKLVYAACLDHGPFHGWLMWKHPDGQWVSKRKLESWEVMQAEDQQRLGIVQETHTRRERFVPPAPTASGEGERG